MIKILLISLIAWGIRLLLSLRYSLHVKGLEALLKKGGLSRNKGVLFLPNHPAEIDPVILSVLLARHFCVRPLVVEHFYHLKGFRWLMSLVRALPLPDMDKNTNRWRAKRIEKNFLQLRESLLQGDSLLLYPAGRLQRAPLEKLGGASLAHRLYQELPEIQVVLVRTKGLFGSHFSRALTGSSPSFSSILFKGFVILCKNAFFFAPRRRVEIEFCDMTQSLPKKASRLEFNQFLEKWYNQGIEDRVVLVPLFFWSKKVAGVHPKSVPEERVTGPILPEIEKKVITFLSQLSHRPISTITKDQELSQHLGLDSLDLVQIYLFLDEKFNIANLASGSLVTVGDVMQGAGGYLEGTKRQRSEESPFSWREEKRKTSGIPEGAKTIIEAFLLQVDRMGNLSCCADDSFGLMSYSKMKKRALILASQFRKFPEKRVGVMLPSSTAAYLVILALMLANKVPVMLNWTVGTKALDHAIDLLEIKRAITSIRFLDKIELESLGKVEERFYFLEEIRENISLKEVVLSLIDSWKSAKGLIKIFSLDTIGSSDPALFLFTSGTEALPKAVPLSHENILSNQRAALSALSFCASDIFYGVLPPFHSFGFSATGLFPILSGIRVAYAPDPTDSHKMARDIARYKATLFCAAPSFITALFHAAKKEDLVSLRLILSGAEKTPQALFDYVRAHLPNAKLLEGYGITECSPVVTVDREDEPHRGVGKPLPGLEIAIIDPDTQERLLPGKEGVICILGPSVFSGYYGMRVQPFITIGNRSFFQSGDRGFLDERGTLILTGRSKRFVKIGGEMIGLSGIEEELLNAFSVEVAKKEGPSIVIGMKEGEMGKPELVLFTTLSLDRDEVNETLKRSGFGRLVKISTVYHKESLPVLGTGKVNYRALLEGLDS